MSSPPASRDLRAAAALIGGDPVGVLLPASVLLVTYTLWLWLASILPVPAGGPSWWGGFVALGFARVLVVAPFRALVFRSGARQLGLPVPGPGAVGSLAAVGLLASLVEGALAGAVLSGTLGPAWWLAARGAWPSAVMLLATTAPMLVLAAVVSRVTFGYAAVEAGVGGQPPGAALARGWARTREDLVSVVLVVVTGELAVAVGGLLCGAGGLPAAPLVDLTLLHRWRALSTQVAP